MRELSGKTAFISGGASGIGLAMAQAFLEVGMRVVVSDLLPAHCEEAAARLERFSDRARFMCLDVRDRKALAEAADETQRLFGPVRLLCNNAGVGSDIPASEASYEEWDWLFGVNVGGVINGLVTFLPRMRVLQEECHILNTASMASLIPLGATTIYTGTKFAIRGISESLRLALAPHRIGVSVLCPALVRSRIFETDRYRPVEVAKMSAGRAKPTLDLLQEFGHAAMDPAEVACHVLRGIRNNDAYILTHPECKEEVRELFDEILSAFPNDTQVPAGRIQFEATMRAMRDTERAAARPDSKKDIQ